MIWGTPIYGNLHMFSFDELVEFFIGHSRALFFAAISLCVSQAVHDGHASKYPQQVPRSAKGCLDHWAPGTAATPFLEKMILNHLKSFSYYKIYHQISRKISCTVRKLPVVTGTRYTREMLIKQLSLEFSGESRIPEPQIFTLGVLPWLDGLMDKCHEDGCWG